VAQWTIQFQEFLLAHALQDTEFLEHVAPDLDPSLFTSDIAQRIVRLIRDFYNREKSAPGALIKDVVQEYKTKGLVNDKLSQQLLLFIEQLLELKLENRRYLLDRFAAFIKGRLLLKTVTKVVELAKREEYDKADELVNQYVTFKPASAKATLTGGGFYDRDPVARLARRTSMEEEKLLFMIPAIDRMGVSIGRGQLMIFASQFSGAGKSLALLHMVRMSLFQGKKVLYLIAGEMTREDIEDRLDQANAALTNNELVEKSELLEKRINYIFSFGGDLYIHVLPSNCREVPQLRDLAVTIENTKGFKPDVVVLDYLDNLKPTDNDASNIHLAEDEIAKRLKDWALDDALYMITATQGTKGAHESTVTTLAQVGGSVGKGEQADLLMTLNRTPDETQKNLLRCFWAKGRRFKGLYDVTIRTDFDRCLFYAGMAAEERDPPPQKSNQNQPEPDEKPKKRSKFSG
jgi:archaellum biogenesis ATPase FlaH